MRLYPEYSVLMSVYSRENPDYLFQSIESMMNQTVEPSEFLIVKDGPLTPELDGVWKNIKTGIPISSDS
jgi:cellulose synthase/poly-beta-1,6-N-acetylglucosamine synthase-like glycosyltransferase